MDGERGHCGYRNDESPHDCSPSRHFSADATPGEHADSAGHTPNTVDTVVSNGSAGSVGTVLETPGEEFLFNHGVDLNHLGIWDRAHGDTTAPVVDANGVVFQPVSYTDESSPFHLHSDSTTFAHHGFGEF
jgi:hypothetical protein